ncbi:hypothetical protein, partial [Microseira sp. BLCC-F43]|uniref:hypothetical protein n=1 Tax=Microseira sp. BLCC-F43 TaxID=3153602 RepID=UPI0035B93579
LPIHRLRSRDDKIGTGVNHLCFYQTRPEIIFRIIVETLHVTSLQVGSNRLNALKPVCFNGLSLKALGIYSLAGWILGAKKPGFYHRNLRRNPVSL